MNYFFLWQNHSALAILAAKKRNWFQGGAVNDVLIIATPVLRLTFYT